MPGWLFVSLLLCSTPVLIAFFGEAICAILQLINKAMYSLAMFIERLTREIEKNKKSES